MSFLCLTWKRRQFKAEVVAEMRTGQCGWAFRQGCDVSKIMKTEASRTNLLRNQSLEKPGGADDCGSGRIFFLFRTGNMKKSACNDVQLTVLCNKGPVNLVA